MQPAIFLVGFDHKAETVLLPEAIGQGSCPTIMILAPFNASDEMTLKIRHQNGVVDKEAKIFTPLGRLQNVQTTNPYLKQYNKDLNVWTLDLSSNETAVAGYKDLFLFHIGFEINFEIEKAYDFTTFSGIVDIFKDLMGQFIAMANIVNKRAVKADNTINFYVTTEDSKEVEYEKSDEKIETMNDLLPALLKLLVLKDEIVARLNQQNFINTNNLIKTFVVTEKEDS